MHELVLMANVPFWLLDISWRLLSQKTSLYLRARGNAAVIGDCLTRRNFAPGEPGSQYGRPLRGLPITAAL
jgi:hypothetical protein